MNRIVNVYGATLIVALTGCQSMQSRDEIPVVSRKATETRGKSSFVSVRDGATREMAAVQANRDAPLLGSKAGATMVDSVGNSVLADRTTEKSIRVFFDFDTFRTELGVLAQYIPKGVGILVTGHTDSVGAAQYNLRLGMRRAQFVADSLSDAGVERARMTVASRGESEPIFSNDAAVGRAKNRRVEVLVAPSR